MLSRHASLRRASSFLVYLLCAAAIVACGGSDDDDDEPTPSALSMRKIGGYASPDGETAAEIPAFDAASKRAFVVNGALGSVDVLDLADPSQPRKIASIETAAIGANLGGVNSVAVHGGIVALAIEAADKQQPGSVAFVRAADLVVQSVATVGALPDMLTFTPDGKKVLVANEGEPNAAYTVDPEGSVSVIDVADVAKPTVRTAGFAAFNAQAAALRTAGVRLFGPNASVAQDLEPEYVAVSPDGTTAWVTLQENNALAVVDIAAATVTHILPLGYKNHLLPGKGFDASDRDNAISIRNWPVLGMYMPDAIAAYAVDGQTYLITANEGDARAYDGFTEEARVSTLALDAAVFTTAACGGVACTDASALGRLTVTNTLGAQNGVYSQLYVFGGRSFSIWNATTGAQVFDSGDELEQRTKALPNVAFNADNAGNAVDNRSDNKGPEPEGVAVARFGKKVFAFIGLERVGGVMVYDVSVPGAPVFATYLNTRDAANGDLGPEGLAFVPATSSPNGKPLLIVGNEISGTTAIFQIDLSY